MQSRIGAAVETCFSTAVGYLLSLLVQVTVLPLYGVRLDLHQNAQIVGVFTAVSLLRGYGVRRLFNYLHHGRNKTMQWIITAAFDEEGEELPDAAEIGMLGVDSNGGRYRGRADKDQALDLLARCPHAFRLYKDGVLRFQGFADSRHPDLANAPLQWGEVHADINAIVYRHEDGSWPDL